MWPIRSVLSDNEWQPKSTDLKHSHLAFDGSASDFFHRFSCEPSGIVTLFVKVFLHLSEPLFLHHHRDRVRSNNKPYRCDSLCLKFSSKVHHRC